MLMANAVSELAQKTPGKEEEKLGRLCELYNVHMNRLLANSDSVCTMYSM